MEYIARKIPSPTVHQFGVEYHYGTTLHHLTGFTYQDGVNTYKHTSHSSNVKIEPL